MKSCLAFALAVSLGAPLFGGEIKVGTVDLQEAIARYHKTPPTLKQLKEDGVSFLKEFEGLKLERQKLVEEAERYRGLSLEPALREDAAAKARSDFALKVQDLRAFEIKLELFVEQRGAEVKQKQARLTGLLLADVKRATVELGRKEGFNLILNADSEHAAASGVLFVQGLEDLTPKVIAALNRDAKNDAAEKPANHANGRE